MKYQNKWILSHLGLTRKTLSGYEDMGLIDRRSTQNPENKYREYSEDDLERLWVIWFLNQVGFHLSEVKTIIASPSAELWNTLNEKIERFEHEKSIVDGKIHALQYMSATGHIPMPKKIGEVKFEDLLSGIQSGLYDDDDIRTIIEMHHSDAKDVEDQLSKIVAMFERLVSEENVQSLLESLHLINICTDTILLKKKCFSPEDEETQQAVALTYEVFCNMFFKNNQNEMTRDFFARYVLPLYSEFGFGVMNQEKYGAENCKFINDAITYFAGQDKNVGGKENE